MSLRFAVSLLCLFFASVLAALAESASVLKAPVPAWIVDYPVDLQATEPAEGIRDGNWTLLADDQINGQDYTRFCHYARKFTTENAIRKDSRIQVDFNPAYQTLTWHKLQVYRDGKVLDRLPQQSFRVLAREEKMERNLYDGSVSAVIELEDLEVGDVVEYSYSIQGQNPIFAGKFSDYIYTTWSSPVHQLRIRLLWPSGRPIFYQEKIKRLQSFTEDKIGDLRDLRWSADDQTVLIADQATPSWEMPYGWLQFTEYSSWNEIVQWALGHYQLDAPLPPKLNPVMDKIRLLPTEEERILAALEYVQDQIRYLSISEGVHSHEPYTVEEVVQRGFGDCKDKARLLCTMLRNLGFDAAPALVDTFYRHTIADWLPTPCAFNHVVVRLKWKGQTYWLDATISHQRGSLEQHYFPDYEKALVIEPGATAFTDIRPSGFDAAAMNVAEHYVVSAYNADVKLNLLTTYRGHWADLVRAYLADKSPAEFSREEINFRARLYPGIREDSKPLIHDDLQFNVFTIEENYSIHDFWKSRPNDNVRVYGELFPLDLQKHLTTPSEPKRSFPLLVEYPRQLNCTITAQFPDDIRFSPESKIISDPAFTYAYDVSQSGRVLTIRHTYRTLKNIVPLADLDAYLSHLREAYDQLDFYIHIPKAWILPGAIPVSPAVIHSMDINWLLVIFAVLILFVGVGACAVLYSWQPAYHSLPNPPDQSMKGLGGWLILLGFSIIFRPLIYLAFLREVIPFVNMDVWTRFTIPGQVQYNPLWSITVFFETLVSVFGFTYGVLLIVLFFQKRRSFPILMAWMLASVPVFTFVIFLLLHSLTQKGQIIPSLITLIPAFIWILYLRKSKRVAATFIHGGRLIERGET